MTCEPFMEREMENMMGNGPRKYTVRSEKSEDEQSEERGQRDGKGIYSRVKVESV